MMETLREPGTMFLLLLLTWKSPRQVLQWPPVTIATLPVRSTSLATSSASGKMFTVDMVGVGVVVCCENLLLFIEIWVR